MDVLMPQLGETVTEGTVTVWHKKVGDKIAANEVLFEVSTDKVDTEVPAPTAGVLTEIAVPEGETVNVGVRLGVIDDGNAVSASAPSAGGSVDVVMPQLGETVSEGTVTVWHKMPGDAVTTRDVLFEVSTDKVDTEVPAPADGVLEEIMIGEGDTVKVGVRLAVISGVAGAPAPVATAAPVAEAAAPVRAERTSGRVGNRDTRGQPLSPVVRRLLSENGLDPSAVSGTGAGGRIKRNDVLAFLKSGSAALAPTSAPASPAPAASKAGKSVSTADGRTIIPFNKLRKLTAEHMVRSKATSPHVLQAVEADFHAVERARDAAQEAWQITEGFTLSYLPFISRAICRAIAEFPRVNAHVEGDNLVVFRRINLGIAVDLGHEGLVAPVIARADRMSVRELARAIRDVATRARNNTLTPDEFSGGTYTISNSGVFGTLITAPIINQPQVAIISTDGVRKKPVVVEGVDGDSIAIRPVGILAQSFDHRAIDGAYSAAFLHRLQQIIEQTDWASELSR